MHLSQSVQFDLSVDDRFNYVLHLDKVIEGDIGDFLADAVYGQIVGVSWNNFNEKEIRSFGYIHFMG